MNENITIKKADGTLEFFDSSKLITSLQKSGATKELSNEVMKQIEKELQDGMKTSYIYYRAFKILREKSEPVASRYSLKRALSEMGPSGFPFELLISEILKEKGYKTETDLIMNGRCVEHEIDVLAKNEKEFIVCEAKFHNTVGVKSDLKVALYVDARCKDLAKGNFDGKKPENLIPKYWLVTNTKFTKNAIIYGRCNGMTMIGWGYPNEGNLQDLIEESNLLPITVLTNLTNQEKRVLFEQGIVLCKSILENGGLLKKIGVKDARIERIINEAKSVLKVKRG
ncbi:MAG: ATP-cone domain-containing protein [Parcubacteria group bacterium Athens0714_16]|nr:MAG: ATP-cone domain-containing protein [Parcubacteria group bacterium Athens0714_16]